MADEGESPDGAALDPDDEDAEDDSAEIILGSVRFDGLSPTNFEEFCFDLLTETGFVNVDWRKGTAKDSSPADRGRDIVAQREREDVDGHKYSETWFVDCKHYDVDKRGVPPEALQATITWAQAERPSVVLFIASGYLTNAAKDWIARYEQESKPPFRIRVWEMPQVRRLLADHMDLAFKHDVETSALRRVSELLAVESELTDKLWYGRKPADDQPTPPEWSPQLVKSMRDGQRQMEEQYGKEELMSHVKDQFSWGMLSGKISALRWVLGEEWDMLDS
jgi:hypothetical protein